MLFIATLIPLLGLAAAKPVQKRYSGVQIVSGRDGKCLAAAPKTGVGSAVTTIDCAQSTYPTLWDINPGSGSVILHGSANPALALDAGSNPGDFGTLTVWQSYPGLYQQTWYLTDDSRIAITGGTQCLDEGDNGPQTYTCTTGNGNQVWNIQTPTGGGGSPSSAVSSSMASATPSSTCTQ